MSIQPYVPPVASGTVPASDLLPAHDASTIPADPVQVYLDSLRSPESKRAMEKCLRQILVMVIETERGEPLPPDQSFPDPRGRAWWRLRYEHTTRIRALLIKHGYASSSVNQHLAALRRVLRECRKLKLMSAEDYTDATDIPDETIDREPAGREVHNDEIVALLAACAKAPSPLRERDAALITILQATGIRRAEAAEALIENYDPRGRWLKITGKGRKERTIPIHKDAVPHLERWLALLGERRGRMFRSVDKHGRIGESLQPQAVYRIVKRHYEEAGLQLMSTHDFRHTFIDNFVESGGDLVQTQNLAGHASPVTTARYDRRGQRGLRDAVDRMPIVVPVLPAEDAPDA